MENITIKITSSIIEGKNMGEITLEGDLSIQNGNKIKEKIKSALSQFDSVRVVVQNVNDIDLGVFQLLYALKKSTPTEISFSSNNFNVPKSTFSLIKRSGMIELFMICKN